MPQPLSQPQRVILVAVDLGEYDVEVSLDELQELASTAGAEVVGRLWQRRQEFDKASCIGAGRVAELREYAKNLEAQLVVFDHELGASQLRNLEREVGVPVIDRTMLILDIFAQRAVTSEGKLQVELAQQRYLLPRLAGLGESLSRLGGGIGTRGPGESKLESDRRHIRRRIQSLERKLAALSARRENMRARRKKTGQLIVAVVGYTNVGKSTLLNALTGAQVLSQDKLFATLDPTARALALPDGREVLLIDTVGFIRRLPHHLIEAFKSTLEVAATADLILNVCDITSPQSDEQLRVSRQLLLELGLRDTPILTVYNKCDRLAALPEVFGRDTVLISARTGMGFEDLLAAIARTLPPAQQQVRLLIPYESGALLAELRREGKVLSEEYTDAGTRVVALAPKRLLYKFEGMLIGES